MKKVLFSLITSFLLTTSLLSQVPAYVPTNGLVGYWPFNGNANDESGNGNHGTVNGATLTADRNGNANNAYSFDGITQYIVCNSIDINSQYSIQAWIRASNSIITSESATGSNSGATYISQGASNSPCNYADFALGLKSGPYFSGSVNCGNIYYNFEQGNNCTFQMKAQCDPIFTELDQWISVTYVCANNSLAFFKNGILQWEISGMSNLNNSGFPLSFGCRLVPNSGDNAYGWWKGQLDDIAIYNRALTQDEITALYNGTTTISGCTKSTACNYNASATQDDGSCTFPAQTYLNCSGACLNDTNNNGICDEVEANFPTYLPANGLVAWYPFNGNANDESGNGNHGTVNGATLTADRNGNANSAYSFDGVSSKINLSQAINFSNNSFTVSLFCKAGDFGNSQIDNYSYIFGSPLSGGTNDQGFRFATNSNLNTYSATIGDQSINDYIIFGASGLNFDWYNLTMVFDRQNATFSFYVNNIIAGSLPVSPNFGNTDSGLLPTIGTFQLNNWIQHYFNGQIDDIAIYNRALTPTEITALYIGATSNGGGNNNNTAQSSVPAGISYQAVARDAQGSPLANTAVQVKFTLITDSLSGTTEYVETHSLSTNTLGLFATAFGMGSAVTGTWAGINWTHANKYLKVELDAGNGFVNLGTQQLLSSPFAIRAQSAAKIENAFLPVFTDNAAALAGGLTSGQLYRTATGDLKVVY